MKELAPLGGEKSSSYAHKTGLQHLLGILSKILDKHHIILNGSPPKIKGE